MLLVLGQSILLSSRHRFSRRSILHVSDLTERGEHPADLPRARLDFKTTVAVIIPMCALGCCLSAWVATLGPKYGLRTMALSRFAGGVPASPPSRSPSGPMYELNGSSSAGHIHLLTPQHTHSTVLYASLSSLHKFSSLISPLRRCRDDRSRWRSSPASCKPRCLAHRWNCCRFGESTTAEGDRVELTSPYPFLSTLLSPLLPPLRSSSLSSPSSDANGSTITSATLGSSAP